MNSAYTGVAMVISESVSYFLVRNDSFVCTWVPAKYFDASEFDTAWRFSAAWGIRTDRTDDGWWRIAVARRELLPHIDTLADSLTLDDPHRAELVDVAIRSETARDSIIKTVNSLASGSSSWLEVSNWALEQLDTDRESGVLYSDIEIEILAELSTLDESQADSDELSRRIIDRI
ncbi:hypothetical protein [Gordonia lacunae]|uniref:hypothetical protein n=1 Tax=Gordonia lacunae TaxID=417102 RepID=UPI001183BD6E|nr:hypothetical protein [Gordonia lacunae]